MRENKNVWETNVDKFRFQNKKKHNGRDTKLDTVHCVQFVSTDIIICVKIIFKKGSFFWKQSLSNIDSNLKNDI